MTPSPASGGGGAGDDARTYAYRQVATAGEHNRSTDELIAAARQEEEIERWRLGLDAVLTPPHPPTKTSSPASGGGGAGDDARTFKQPDKQEQPAAQQGSTPVARTRKNKAPAVFAFKMRKRREDPVTTAAVTMKKSRKNPVTTAPVTDRVMDFAVGNIVGNGRYKLIQQLGDGKHGTVWAAKDLKGSRVHAGETPNDTPVVLKVAKGRHIQHAAKEADNLEKCSGTHIVRLVDRFELHGSVVLVLEQGKSSMSTIVNYLGRKGLTREDNEGSRVVVDIMRKVSRDLFDGLKDLHTKCRMSHSDMKAANVMAFGHCTQILSANCKFKIIDFGGVLPLNPSKRRSVPRTVTYMPPEVVVRRSFRLAPAEDLGDVWSTLITVVSLATRKDLFHRIQCQTSSTERYWTHPAMMEHYFGTLPVHMQQASFYDPEKGTLKALSDVRAGLKEVRDQTDTCTGRPLTKADVVRELPSFEAWLQSHLGRSKSVSHLAAFLKDCLVIGPDKRPSAADILKHPFLTAGAD